MKWRNEYTVDSHDLDYNGVARASVLMRYMQESANAQCRRFGPSLESLRDEKGLAFLLSRFSAGFYTTVYPYDNIIAETWGVESRGFSFNRCYRLWRGDCVVAEATAVWALVDIENRRPIRVTEYTPGFSYDEMLTLDTPARIVFPNTLPLRLVSEHTVSYAETDQNMHLNNTRYSDMLCNACHMKGQRIYRMNLNFLNEARLGETINIYSVHHGESDYFRTLRADGKVNVEAQIIFGEL
ncbi:MAG: hypothetical protein E7609_05120 [Ruminococcaceae bacterium]|nr:hypothetical protein [Oscillospiraceae bacterium]